MNSGGNIHASNQSRHEPIAIIGMSCRLPGAPSVDAFWKLLCEGHDAVTEVPRDRFDVSAVYDRQPAAAGKLVTRWGGFLKDADRFDSNFFGISPREATAMDPQQRLFLETAWEALEDAGQSPLDLAGSDTGVFTGIMTSDYDDLQYYRTDRATIDLYVTTGGYRSVVPGRLSFLLDLRGPSMAVDTGCSSSLVAIHLACQSILTGECSLALAGGTNLVLLPERSMGFSRAEMLSPDGHCKFADARADGFVRSEGVGVVVLKALSLAQKHHDPIYAVILGSAVNNDGSSSGSMATPGRASQEHLLRVAYKRAGVSPGSVAYVEAHGTGTSVGDPVEVGALSTVLSENRAPGKPCLIGSVKSNIGHAEAAAGVAGLIKTVLVLRNRKVPPTIHVKDLNANIPWQTGQLVVPQELTPVLANGMPIVAGVNSFGIAGTNAHVVLQEVMPDSDGEQQDRPAKGPRLLTLSAASPGSLRALAARYREFIRDPCAASLSDLCYTRNVRRTHHDHRLALAVNSVEEVDESLGAFLADEASIGMSSAQVPPEKQKLVFVFPGHGSQWFGMGQELFRHQRVFREKMEECDAAFQRHVNWSLVDELNTTEANSRINEIDVVQHVLFSMGLSLSAVWRSWGILPDAVIGHSMGEVAAAHIAGILSLADAVKIMHSRGHLLKRKAGLGAMAVIDLPNSDVEPLLGSYNGELVIAGSNTRGSSVISGSSAAIEQVLLHLHKRNIFARKVRIDYASHSPQMDDVCGELLQEIRGVTAQSPSIPLYSTVLGGLSNTAVGNANHWIKNLRQPVRFGQAVDALLQDGYRHFLELSPHPILLGAIQQAFHDTGREGKIIPSLRRQEEERQMLLSSLGLLYTLGHAIDWQQVFPEDHRCRCIHLPEYAWQSERFWRDDANLDSHISGTALNKTESIRQTDPTPDVAESLPPTRAVTRDDLLKVSEAEQKVLLQSYLANNMGRILRQSPSKLDVNRPLIKLGIDSLMAVELRNRMIVDLELTLPILKIITARSIVQLVAQMLTHLTAQAGAAGDSQTEKAAGTTTSQPPVEV